MRHTFSILPAIMMMLAAFAGCDIEIPKMGRILRGDVSGGRDTTLTTIIGGPDATASTTDDISSPTDSSMVADITDSNSSTLDSLDPPSDIIAAHDTRDDGSSVLGSCNTDQDCNTDASSHELICVDGVCVEYLECTQDWHCNNHNACDGEEKCLKSPGQTVGHCLFGKPLECPVGSSCHVVGGCVLSEPPSSTECTEDGACLSSEVCSFELGGVCTVADGASCSDANGCDDFNACTYASCKAGSCKNENIICADRNPGTKDVCDPFQGCGYNPYIMLEVRLNVPHNRDTVWLRFATLRWLGDAPYIMHIPVLEACEGGIHLDLNLDKDSEDGWFECPGNPGIADTIESIVIDGVVLNNAAPAAARYTMIDDPEAPCGRSLLISRGELGCPFGM